MNMDAQDAQDKTGRDDAAQEVDSLDDRVRIPIDP